MSMVLATINVILYRYHIDMYVVYCESIW